MKTMHRDDPRWGFHQQYAREGYIATKTDPSGVRRIVKDPEAAAEYLAKPPLSVDDVPHGLAYVYEDHPSGVREMVGMVKVPE